LSTSPFPMLSLSLWIWFSFSGMCPQAASLLPRHLSDHVYFGNFQLLLGSQGGSKLCDSWQSPWIKITLLLEFFFLLFPIQMLSICMTQLCFSWFIIPSPVSSLQSPFPLCSADFILWLTAKFSPPPSFRVFRGVKEVTYWWVSLCCTTLSCSNPRNLMASCVCITGKGVLRSVVSSCFQWLQCPNSFLPLFADFFFHPLDTPNSSRKVLSY
jgi:hypothetical protein